MCGVGKSGVPTAPLPCPRGGAHKGGRNEGIVGSGTHRAGEAKRLAQHCSSLPTADLPDRGDSRPISPIGEIQQLRNSAAAPPGTQPSQIGLPRACSHSNGPFGGTKTTPPRLHVTRRRKSGGGARPVEGRSLPLARSTHTLRVRRESAAPRHATGPQREALAPCAHTHRPTDAPQTNHPCCDLHVARTSTAPPTARRAPLRL